MDFHCLPEGKAPKEGDWYMVCGTPFPNHAEYIVVVTAFALFGLFIYYQMLAKSGKEIKVKTVPVKKKAQ